jgi:hypothetical protein
MVQRTDPAAVVVCCRSEGGCSKDYLESDMQRVRCYVCQKLGHLCCKPAPQVGGITSAVAFQYLNGAASGSGRHYRACGQVAKLHGSYCSGLGVPCPPPCKQLHTCCSRGLVSMPCMLRTKHTMFWAVPAARGMRRRAACPSEGSMLCPGSSHSCAAVPGKQLGPGCCAPEHYHFHCSCCCCCCCRCCFACAVLCCRPLRAARPAALLRLGLG